MVAAKRPSLELIQIASPCTADWESMVGDDRARHCADCQLNVYNISEMTRDEALAFLAQREGRTCVRMYRRADGTVITRDCPVGLAAVRAKVVRMVLATVGLVVAIACTAVAAFGRIPGASGLLAEGKIERVRERYFPTEWAVMGEMHIPTITPSPFVPNSPSTPESPY
jgi:hypothetical protein